MKMYIFFITILLTTQMRAMEEEGSSAQLLDKSLHISAATVQTLAADHTLLNSIQKTEAGPHTQTPPSFQKPSLQVIVDDEEESEEESEENNNASGAQNQATVNAIDQFQNAAFCCCCFDDNGDDMF